MLSTVFSQGCARRRESGEGSGDRSRGGVGGGASALSRNCGKDKNMYKFKPSH